MPDFFLSPGDSRRRQAVRLGSRKTDTALAAPVMAIAPLLAGDHR